MPHPTDAVNVQIWKLAFATSMMMMMMMIMCYRTLDMVESRACMSLSALSYIRMYVRTHVYDMLDQYTRDACLSEIICATTIYMKVCFARFFGAPKVVSPSRALTTVRPGNHCVEVCSQNSMNSFLSICNHAYVCMYVYMYVYMYVCMYAHIYALKCLFDLLKDTDKCKAEIWCASHHARPVPHCVYAFMRGSYLPQPAVVRSLPSVRGAARLTLPDLSRNAPAPPKAKWWKHSYIQVVIYMHRKKEYTCTWECRHERHCRPHLCN